MASRKSVRAVLVMDEESGDQALYVGGSLIEEGQGDEISVMTLYQALKGDVCSIRLKSVNLDGGEEFPEDLADLDDRDSMDEGE